MATKETVPIHPADLTFTQFNQHVQSTNQVAQYIDQLELPVTPLDYFNGGIVEEAFETFSGSESPAYERSYLPFVPLALARDRRANIDLSFPRDVQWQIAEYGDMLWYQTAALNEVGVSLQGAVNVGVTAATGEAVTLTTFSQLDEHIRDNPKAIQLPNRLKQKGLHPLGKPGLGDAALPDTIDCEYSSSMVFGTLLRKLVSAFDHLDRFPDESRNQHIAQAAQYAGQLTWCKGFILQQRFNSSLTEVAAKNVEKAARRKRMGTTFGSGDAR